MYGRHFFKWENQSLNFLFRVPIALHEMKYSGGAKQSSSQPSIPVLLASKSGQHKIGAESDQYAVASFYLQEEYL